MAIQALIFDVFGTLLDWHGGVAREAVRLLAPFRPDLDGAAFARAWRDRYQPGMEPIRQGARSYADLDTLHAESLDGVLAGLHLAETVPPEVHHELVLAWHRLDAWPEVPDALARFANDTCWRPAPMRMSGSPSRRPAATGCLGTRCSEPSSLRTTSRSPPSISVPSRLCGCSPAR